MRWSGRQAGPRLSQGSLVPLHPLIEGLTLDGLDLAQLHELHAVYAFQEGIVGVRCTDGPQRAGCDISCVRKPTLPAPVSSFLWTANAPIARLATSVRPPLLVTQALRP